MSQVHLIEVTDDELPLIQEALHLLAVQSAENAEKNSAVVNFIDYFESEFMEGLS